jgi:hypothetical protein
MPLFRAPEIAGRAHALDDEAFVDGANGGAEIVREIARLGNLHATREHLVWRWSTRARATGLEQGYGLTSAPPFWQGAVPLPTDGLPVRKMHGATRLRVAVLAEIDADRVIELHVGTTLSPTPTRGAPSLVMRGTGAVELYTAAGVVCRRQAGEQLSVAHRALVDIDNDPLLDTVTYGGNATGTFDAAPTLFSARDTGAAWNAIGDVMHEGGHYVVTRDAQGAQRMAAAEVRAVGPDTGGGTTDEILFWGPAVSHNHLVGATYEIRKLPLVRYVSIAIYTEDGTA